MVESPRKVLVKCGKKGILETTTDYIEELRILNEVPSEKISESIENLYNKPKELILDVEIEEQTNAPEWMILRPFKKLAKIFNRNETGETLCDFELLSWSYLEAGLLITLGCLGAFFFILYNEGVPFSHFFNSSQNFFKTESQNSLILKTGKQANSLEQLEILYKAQSAYFLSILIGQSFNILACKRKTEYINFKSFSNILPFLGTIFGLITGAIIIYSKSFNNYLFSRPFDLFGLVFPIITGLILLFWDSLRKFIRNRFNFFGSKEKVDIVGLVRTASSASYDQKSMKNNYEF